MGYKTIDKVYNDSEENSINVCIMTFGARKGIRIQAKLIKIIIKFGIGFFSVLGQKDKAKEMIDNGEKANFLNTDIDLSKIDLNQVATLLISELDEKNILELIMDLLGSTKIDNKPMTNVNLFDDTFAGEYGLLIEIIKDILEVNFKSFFVNGAIGKILSKVKESSIVPNL